MVNIKKILGILLALCFVLSVTAASAAASGDNRGPRDGPGDRDKPKFDNHKPKFDDHRPKFDDHNKKRHHHPAHWENKRVGHREFMNNQWTIIYVIEKVYVSEYWGSD